LSGARYGQAKEPLKVSRGRIPDEPVRQLETDAVDDALDLFDLLMATRLLARAEKLGERVKLRSLPASRRAAGKMAAAIGVLLELAPAEESPGSISLPQAWERIERVAPRSELTSALEQIDLLVPADDGDDNTEWRAEVVKRYGSVTAFLRMLAGRRHASRSGSRRPRAGLEFGSEKRHSEK
jgi:hypothetical protein